MKLIIIGNGGTGKSTLGDMLGKKLNIPVYHTDQMVYKAKWERVPENEFKANLAEIFKTGNCIIEGWGYNSTLKQRLDEADTIIYLAYPVWLSYVFAIKRYFQYYFKQNPYDPPGAFRRHVLKRTLEAMWLVHKTYEPELRQMLPEYQDKKKVFIFKNRKELRKFLKTFQGNL